MQNEVSLSRHCKNFTTKTMFGYMINSSLSFFLGGCARRKGASLKPKHTIFLSHSGVHRDFTEQLCKDLEALQYFSFCDIRPDSLPKGEEFPPLIIKAAGQCRLAILVLSREYFMRSKWPMVELTEFVRAQRSINPDLRIVPLYFKISINEFKDARTRATWKKRWQSWKNDDSRIDVMEWVRATKVLDPINGIVYDEAQGEVTYRSKVVKAICKLTPPDLEWDDSYIQAKPRLYEVFMQTLFPSLSFLYGMSFQNEGIA